MEKMLSITKKDSFHTALDQSAYGWPYNPPGIELAFAGEVFGMDEVHYCQAWVQRQLARTYDETTRNPLTRGAVDVSTSAARIYEATRLGSDY
jgi:hypothetical protein